MTASEAIERIDEVLESEYRFDETLGYQLTSDDFEWLEKAKEALEKQMPNKVEKSYSYLDGQLVNFLCANCGNAQGFKVNKRCQKYCPYCGQALDWSDT